MATFLDLPPECIVGIFLYLEPCQIATGRLISRAFWTIIDDSLELKYILELDYLGIDLPPTLSNELSLRDKVCALQEKRLKIGARSIGADSMTHIYLDSKDHGNIVVRPFESYTFSRGVFAFKGENWPNKLGIFQFSSENRGIDCDRYTLNCPPDNFMMAVEPSFDLLVLFGKTDEGVAFHLRSIGTGLPHPSASSARILCSSPTGIRILTFPTIKIEIVGRHIVHMQEISEQFCSLITIWDWVSGQIVTSTKVVGYSFTFLSEDIFLVPPPIPDPGYSPPGGDSHPLALYTCSRVLPGSPARHIARFHFPTLDGIQMRYIQFEHSPLPLCGYPIPYVSPPRIYDTSSASHHLVLEISFSGLGYGSLFIRSHGLLSFVDLDITVTDHDECLSIPWSKWISATSWISHCTLGVGWNACRVFGHVVTRVSQGNELNHWEVEIFDLRTSLRMPLPGPQLGAGHLLPEEQMNFFLSSGCMSVPHPSLVKAFSIPAETIPWDDDWYETTSHLRGVDLMVDDEHIVIFKSPSETVKASIHVYSL
ncbi:unnamed protein product [Rhizoctonia solani]|uniref:F-box domain-containing protein n=1 Tax=Rhizoctonia solani TaxID=456999 RepID=A0A8H3HWB1_9AGAM|nr:unnamed protein product [Rhizoctonia solani]